jgi:hypothetical protein
VIPGPDHLSAILLTNFVTEHIDGTGKASPDSRARFLPNFAAI